MCGHAPRVAADFHRPFEPRRPGSRRRAGQGSGPSRAGRGAGRPRAGSRRTSPGGSEQEGGAWSRREGIVYNSNLMTDAWPRPGSRGRTAARWRGWPASPHRAGALPHSGRGDGPAPATRSAAGPRLLVKRDDTIPFGFGGNKIRKLPYVLAEAVASGADTIITCGGVQSNHARATTAAAVRLACGRCWSPTAPRGPSHRQRAAHRLMGAEIHYVASREKRAPRDGGARRRTSARRAGGRTSSRSALPRRSARSGSCRRSASCSTRSRRPDVIVHACSSGGTQAGLAAGLCPAWGGTRVIGISADDPAAAVLRHRPRHHRGHRHAARDTTGRSWLPSRIEVRDDCVGEGYGIPTEASEEAQALAARTEALFVDHTYTAKALGALIEHGAPRGGSRETRPCSSGTRAGRWGSSPSHESPIERMPA